MPESPYPMLPVSEAKSIILREMTRLPSVTVPFTEAYGLVLAEDVTAANPIPEVPTATVDGFAVRAADSGARKIVGAQMAGELTELRVDAGEAARVTTGAPIPGGADAMVMIEDTIERDGMVEITAPVSVGDNIRPVGNDIAAGQMVLPAGTVLHPPEIGLLAMLGKITVRVFPRPKVGIMSTGDELLEPHEPLQPGKIRDANRFTLMGAVRNTGGEPIDFGMARDEPGGLAALIERALPQVDILLTSGGVSMGQRDFVKPYIAEHGTLFVGRVNAKPGKPVTFGLVRGKPFFALPGNPVSALVGFENFVRPALLKMMGHTQLERPRRRVVLEHDIRHSPDRVEFQRAVVTFDAASGTYRARNTGGQGSARLLSLHGANALLILPDGQTEFPAGSTVTAILLAEIG